MSGAAKKRARADDEIEAMRKEVEALRKELAKTKEGSSELEGLRKELAESHEECCKLQAELNQAATEFREVQLDLVFSKKELQDSKDQIDKAQEYLDGDAEFLGRLQDSELDWAVQDMQKRLDKFKEEENRRLDEWDWEKQCEEEGWLQEFICPITHQIMQDPVIAEDGIVYERSAIEKWMQSNDTSPKKKTPMGTQLIQVLPMKNMIQGKTNEMRKKRKLDGNDSLNAMPKGMENEPYKIKKGRPDPESFYPDPNTPTRSPSPSMFGGRRSLTPGQASDFSED